MDPIDGTRGFLAGRNEWCVSIGIVEHARPVVGVLQCPALKEEFAAMEGGGAYLNGKALELLGGSEVKSITGSRKLNDAMKASAHTLDVVDFVPSLAYRIAMVATGQLDAALARPGAHDWDLAAAHVILNEAGGVITDPQGKPRSYNQTSPRSGALLASGEKAHARLMELAKSGGFLH